MKIETLRGMVRPIVTFLVMAVLAGITVLLVIKYADADLAKIVVGAFLSLVSVLGTFWFTSRNKPPTDTPKT